METLTTIHRAVGIDIHGKTVSRTAVRGVILCGRDLLMIHSTKAGDYKFPGGGVDEGESHAQALAREIQEECGAVLTHIGREIGAVVEYNFAVEDEFDTFKMTSHYYLCGVQDGLGAQRLDDYERDLGFEPVWMPLDEALRINRSLLESAAPPEWLSREIFMLEYLQR
jgi:8-oxo-dGTP pyrophosphatase MutT (NUDIX family)